jgi:hypothetical protein
LALTEQLSNCIIHERVQAVMTGARAARSSSMSKIAVAYTLGCGLGLVALFGCGSDDSDSDPNPSGGSGGVIAGSGGAIAGSGGMSGGGAAGSAGSGGTTMMGSGGATMMGSGGAGMPGGAPTFSRVWNEVLVVKTCNGAFCHGIGMANLSMKNKDDAYLNLVNVAAAGPSCGMTGMLRVKPGDPTQSLLLDKISHAMPACGDPMPIGARLAPDCLSMQPTVCNTEFEIALVRDWIAAGANND